MTGSNNTNIICDKRKYALHNRYQLSSIKQKRVSLWDTLFVILMLPPYWGTSQKILVETLSTPPGKRLSAVL